MKILNGKIVFEGTEDLLPLAMSLGGTDWNRTGSWKFWQPYFQNLTPPCVGSCRVGNDIVTFMQLIEERRFREAAQGLIQNNPFPAVLGRVCPHPCEGSCNRCNLGGPISIQGAERFLGDYALTEGCLPEMQLQRKKTVAVVGAGPSGLSAAYFLRQMGYSVTVFEAQQQAGGLLWAGIPPYRLPRPVLDGELERFTRMGVKLEFGIKLGKQITVESLRKNYAAVLLAIGRGKSRVLGIPGEDHPQVVQGIELLRMLHEGKKPQLGKKVAVVGGGNTAIDCARSLMRLGHCVTVVYRRSPHEMPVFQDELTEAMEEQVEFEFLAAPVRIQTVGSQILALECIRTRPGPPDETGRSRPIPVPNSEFLIPAESIVIATGEILDQDGLPENLRENGRIVVTQYQTSLEGVFACGDCAGDGGTVAEAVRTGRESAFAVNAYLRGESFSPPDLLAARKASPEIAVFNRLHLHYFHHQAGPSENRLTVDERQGNFQEVRYGFSQDQILYEAKRCFKCGTCNTCGNCNLFCPDGAVQRDPTNGRYQILYEYCKGCLVCVEECPRAAIHAQKVEV